MSGSQRKLTPRNSIVFWNTKKSANRIGSGISIGRQPENALNGLMPCSPYTFIISCCSLAGSPLNLSCTCASSGWMRCILRLERIAVWFSGQSMRRIPTAKTTNSQPYENPVFDFIHNSSRITMVANGCTAPCSQPPYGFAFSKSRPSWCSRTHSCGPP